MVTVPHFRYHFIGLVLGASVFGLAFAVSHFGAGGEDLDNLSVPKVEATPSSFSLIGSADAIGLMRLSMTKALDSTLDVRWAYDRASFCKALREDKNWSGDGALLLAVGATQDSALTNPKMRSVVGTIRVSAEGDDALGTVCSSTEEFLPPLFEPVILTKSIDVFEKMDAGGLKPLGYAMAPPVGGAFLVPQ